MKFKVYPTNKEKVKETYFKLEETYSNSVRLLIVNKDGINVAEGAILEVSSKGVRLYSGIDNKLGILLDRRGHVQITFE
jgi:hypothetical protein